MRGYFCLGAMRFRGSFLLACRWLLLASTLLTTVPCVAGDRASSQCVQLGQTIRPYNYQTPTYTIGTEQFTTVNIRELGNAVGFSRTSKNDWDQTCEGNGFANLNSGHEMDYCPKNVDIRTNLVRQDGKVLRGWLYTEIELNDAENDTMEYIYVQVRDEHFSAIGEFVTDEKEQCKTEKEGLVQPTPYQVYPCGAIGFREVKASSAVFVAKRSQYEHLSALVDNLPKGVQYITKDDLTRGIGFTWRLSEFWCSRHNMFRFEANILTAKYKALGRVDKFNLKLIRKAADYWLHPAWFGAADIKVGEKELDCSLPAINYVTGEVSTGAAESWIKPNATRLTFGNDLTNPGHIDPVSQNLRNCVLKPYDLISSDNRIGSGRPSTRPKFGGRCASHTNSTPSFNYTQGCEGNLSDPQFQGLNFTSYSEYTETIIKGRLKQCEQTCVVPDKTNKSHLADIQKFPKRSGNRSLTKPRVSLATLREARAESRNTTFWQTRKFHGNICVFVAMFLIPVSNFIARYYKETFMASAHGVPAWLWSHGWSGYVALTLIRCSYTAMRENINNWGQSLDSNGEWHRWLGYTFIVIYTLMSTLGGVRILKNRLKIASVIAHAVTGFSLYAMAIYLVVSSQHIPGSPSASCSKRTKLPDGTSQTAIYAWVWVGLDILFHVLMTVWQILLDKREQIRRPGLMGFPFVPMMQPKDQRNFSGAGFRKIVLIIYVTVSFTMTFLVIGGMFVNDDHLSCELGNFTCDDRENPFGCSPISMKYFNIVISERYHVTADDLEK